jgi:hypothetical protein
VPDFSGMDEVSLTFVAYELHHPKGPDPAMKSENVPLFTNKSGKLVLTVRNEVVDMI